MKTLDLNAYGVQEINCAEMQKTDGGSFLIGLAFFALCGFVGCIIYGAANDGNPGTVVRDGVTGERIGW